MGIESSDDIESSSLSTSSEAPSEKQREAAKKAHSQLQKTQKDEKKAKTDNDALFQILVHFIKNPYYEELVPYVTHLLEKSFPSRYILGIVSLIYPDAALYLFHTIGEHEKAHKITELHRYPTKTAFHEQDIHPSLREWVSLWVSALEKFLILPGVSVINTQKLHILLKEESFNLANDVSGAFFRFFFSSRNVEISEKQSRQYAIFINNLLQKTLEKYLESADIDLKKIHTVDEKDLFGI